MDKDLIHDIAEQIYSLFVVNTAAAGIQQKDGIYITEYIPVTPFLIENMVLAKGSMGCYQQGYKTGYLKWICLDFDCKDKINPDVKKLHNEVIAPVTDFLNKNSIRYLTEFSGRRGIHVWIVFDHIIEKSLGFRILNEILRNVPFEGREEGNWGLDKFPATDSSKNNTVGKQVKFPLSTHRAGGMSYFYRNAFEKRDDLGSDCFFRDQYEILCEYQENCVDYVMEALGLRDEYRKIIVPKYKKYRVLDTMELTVDELWSVLIKTRVFEQIYNRMRRGQSLPQDWTVILGTLSPCEKSTSLLCAVFRRFPNYDAEKTAKNIKHFKDRYFPATFEYLYYLYDLEIEDWLNPEMTGFEFLCANLDIMMPPLESHMVSGQAKKGIRLNIEDTINKEKEYLLYNDESPDIYIWNQLHLMRLIDRQELEEVVKTASSTGIYQGTVDSFRVFERKDSEDRVRKLVSLSARDRVVTTQLALELCCEYKQNWRSFSYRPALTARKDIFYAWYQSWGNYIDKIRSFLRVPFFEEYEILFVDLRGFYDHIDFLAVYNALSERISEKASNILRSLISYNDMLMAQITAGSRIGVPQGPAYARIIAEIYLNKIFSDIEERYGNEIIVLRYVDDITIICRPGFNSIAFFNELRDILSKYGLPINTEKSHCYGMIQQLTDEQKKALLHIDNFNYDLRNDFKDEVLLDQERRRNLSHYLEDHSFDMRSLGYIFGSKTMQEAKEWCFKHYRKQIIGSSIGRGSNFRRFYEYIFKHKRYLNAVLSEKILEDIPVNSVNFSNFINTLYMVVQEQKIESHSFEQIKEEYLSTIEETSVDANDLAVIDALKLIHLEEKDDEP